MIETTERDTDRGGRPKHDVVRDGVLTLVTAVPYAAWYASLDALALIGTLILLFPITAFFVVPLHFELQRPRGSSVVAAFVTWLLSSLTAVVVLGAVGAVPGL